MRNTSFIPVENLHCCERKPQQRCCNHHCSPIYSIRRVPGKGYALLSKPQQLPSCYKRKIWPLSFLTIYIAFASRLTVSRIPLSNLVVSGDSTETQQTTVLRVAPEDAGCLIFEKGTAEWAWFLGTDFVGTQHSSDLLSINVIFVEDTERILTKFIFNHTEQAGPNPRQFRLSWNPAYGGPTGQHHPR